MPPYIALHHGMGSHPALEAITRHPFQHTKAKHDAKETSIHSYTHVCTHTSKKKKKEKKSYMYKHTCIYLYRKQRCVHKGRETNSYIEDLITKVLLEKNIKQTAKEVKHKKKKNAF